MLTQLSQKNFNAFRNRLIDYSRRFNIPNEDIEEIVNDSILKALKYFDNDRGSFESLCNVIIKNKIINFKRDNASLYLLVLIDNNEDIVDADVNSFEEKEENEIARTYLLILKSKLSEEELKLFNELYEMSKTGNKMIVSQASKNIGIEATKGWDIFRKIQRKAQRHRSSIALREGSDLLSVCESEEIPYKILNEQAQQLPERASDYEINQFVLSLSEESNLKLNSIYNY